MSQPARFFCHGEWTHRGRAARTIFADYSPQHISREIMALRRELARPLPTLREQAICCVYLGVARAALRRKLERRAA